MTSVASSILAGLLAAGVVAAGSGLARRMAHRQTGQPRSTPGTGSLWRDARGSATLEFTLVLPVLLVILLALVQVSLLLGANLFVHQAAFAATRAAVVQVPRDDRGAGGLGPNVYVQGGGPKYEAIRAAAVWTVVPVRGRLESSALSTDRFVDTLHQLYGRYGEASPNWIDRLAADRLRYADAHTDITVMETRVRSERDLRLDPLPEGAVHTFGPRDPVTVRVTHRLALTVPYINALFGDGRHDDGTVYTTVSAHYTLTNEGVDRALPPTPELPREP
jgi:hypothetical protein